MFRAVVFAERLDASLTNSQAEQRVLVWDHDSKNPWTTGLMGPKLNCFLEAIWLSEMYTLLHGFLDLCPLAPGSHHLSTAEETRCVHPGAGKTPPPTLLLLGNQRRVPQKSPHFGGDS